MLKDFFGRKLNPSGSGKTGIFIIKRKLLTELLVLPGKGSINDVINEIGFDPTQIHVIYAHESLLLDVIGVKIFTKEPVFIIVRNKKAKIDFSLVDKELKNVNWNFEYSSNVVESILTEGIDKQTLSYDFLKTVLILENEGDSLFNAPSIGLYLNFKENVLESFTSSDWLNAASKWLKDVNKTMFDSMFSEAMLFHRNKIEAMEEVNMQCEALQGIPNAIKNEFISHHRKLNGNINFYNLLAAHYNTFNNKRIKIEEFLIVNKGRFNQVNDLTFEVDGFVYQFDLNGILLGLKPN